MAGSESGWHYAGESNVSSKGYVNIPDRVFEEEILSPDRVAYWSYEKTVGFVLISNQPLEKPEYKGQGNSNIGAPPSHPTNVPKEFFEDFEGSGKGDLQQPLPEKARFEYGERRFFAFRTEMAQGETRSCYVFNWSQFDNTIGDDSWADPLDDLPRFVTEGRR